MNKTNKYFINFTNKFLPCVFEIAVESGFQGFLKKSKSYQENPLTLLISVKEEAFLQ